MNIDAGSGLPLKAEIHPGGCQLDASRNVLISHPGHLLVAYQAAIAMQEAGYLGSFETGYYFKDGKLLRSLLGLLPAALSSRIRRQLGRRSYSGLAPANIHTHPLAEIVSVLIARSRWLSRFAGIALQLRNDHFDAVVARKVRKVRPRAVICYDSCAEKSFAAAREVGAIRILDQVIGHIRTGAAILAEESALHPEFADTVGGIASPQSVARCSREAAAADTVLVPSEYVRDTLVENGVAASRIALCPYGVDIDRFTPQPRTRSGTFRFLFVGQIGQRKGIKYLLEAFESLRLPDAELVLLGKVVGSSAGLRQYEGMFRHVRYVPYGELPVHYREADVFVYPSLHEGSALATYEALASGLPVVTTYNSGSVVRDGVDGYIVPIRDAATLAARMARLYHDKDQRTAMATEARKRAESFTWEAYRRRLTAIVQGCVPRSES